MSGVNNPNYSQALQVKEYFSEKDSVVMIGDFNAPKSFFGSRSNSYYVLEQAFGESVVESLQDTFIDARSSFGSYSLDHAFISEDLRVHYEAVLPFAGSDHLPIYIVVE
ncbi:MAG: endonuclease/exonuclease/phosphatase family protein [Bdellovibrionales bacterium]